jgi:hypothetical protein
MSAAWRPKFLHHGMHAAGDRRVARAAALLAFVPAAGALAGAAGAQPALAAVPEPYCVARGCTMTFMRGTGQSFTVPAGVSSLSVTLYGGTGGSASGSPPGGDGAEVTAGLAVSPGTILGIDVGGTGTGGLSDIPGGVNGGGSGFNSGSGGGATDVTDSGTPLLVAGGGGGAATTFSGNQCLGIISPAGGAGGNADTAGGTGQSISSGGFTLAGGSGGSPGTAAGPGAGGLGGTVTGTDPCAHDTVSSGRPGAAGSGPNGGNATAPSSGGGGGGGYFGGGAGGGGASSPQAGSAAAGGGGGGSSYTGGGGVSGAMVTDTGNSGQVSGGSGEAVFTYADPVATGAPGYTATAGQTLSVSAASGLLSTKAGTTGSGLTASGPAGGSTAAGGTVNVNGDGSFRYTPPSGFTGGDIFGYTVTDGSGNYATGTATLDVQPIAQMITFTTTPPSPAVAGGSYTPAATGGGSGNPVTFSIGSATPTGACSLSGGVVSFGTAGTCVLDANQAGGGAYSAAPQASQTIAIDQAPAFVADSPPLTATNGQPYSYTFTASGSPAPSYALAAGAPSWLSVSSSTGTVSGTPPADTTSFSYQVTATNPAGTATAGPFTVTVTAASAKADVAAALSCPHRLTVGRSGRCVLTVTDHGPAVARSVTAAVALPAGLARVSCSRGCARHGSLVTWTRPALAAGASSTFTVTVKATRAGKAVPAGLAVSRSPDPDLFNNFALATIVIRR